MKAERVLEQIAFDAACVMLIGGMPLNGPVLAGLPTSRHVLDRATRMMLSVQQTAPADGNSSFKLLQHPPAAAGAFFRPHEGLLAAR